MSSLFYDQSASFVFGSQAPLAFLLDANNGKSVLEFTFTFTFRSKPMGKWCRQPPGTSEPTKKRPGLRSRHQLLNGVRGLFQRMFRVRWSGPPSVHGADRLVVDLRFARPFFLAVADHQCGQVSLMVEGKVESKSLGNFYGTGRGVTGRESEASRPGKRMPR